MPAQSPSRGEVWMVDFGLAAKVRPALVLSIEYRDEDRAIIGVVPHTTSVRGSAFEVVVPVRFLSAGAFLIQGFAGMPPRHFMRRLGVLMPEQLALVEHGMRHWLGL